MDSIVYISEGLQGILYLLELGAKDFLTEGRGAHREAEEGETITSNGDVWKEVGQGSIGIWRKGLPMAGPSSSTMSRTAARSSG